MTDDTLRRTIRLVVVQELTMLAKALGGQSAANSYALDSLRAEQDREAAQRAAEPVHDPRPWWRRGAPTGGRGGPLARRHGAKD